MAAEKRLQLIFFQESGPRLLLSTGRGDVQRRQLRHLDRLRLPQEDRLRLLRVQISGQDPACSGLCLGGDPGKAGLRFHRRHRRRRHFRHLLRLHSATEHRSGPVGVHQREGVPATDELKRADLRRDLVDDLRLTDVAFLLLFL